MQQLHPKSFWLFFINGMGLPVFLVIGNLGFWIAAVSSPDESFLIFLSMIAMAELVGILIIVAGVAVYAKLAYKNYRYELREEGFRKEYGVIWKKYTTIPYERIQNVDINRGLVARLLGLSDLQIQTAGSSITYGAYGAGSEGRLPGLAQEVAEQLRDELIRRAKGKADTAGL